MKLIKYSQTYEKEVVALWNKCLFFDSLTVDKFRKQALFDENFDEDLAYIALASDKVVGFILGIKRKFPYLERGLEPDRGWISVVFVDKEYRKKGIGTKLVEIAENKLKEMGTTNITLCAYSPNYFLAGLDAINYPESVSFFEKLGYKGNEKHFSMGRDIHGFNLSNKILKKKEEVEKEGYSFVPFSYDKSLELLSFLKEEFGGGWKRNALMAMQENKAQDRIYLVFNPKKEICGFACRAIDENEMRFGPIGISKKERNKGLGSILFELQLYEMSKRGIYHMFFISTEENGRRYYERLGLKVIREFIDYRKNI